VSTVVVATTLAAYVMDQPDTWGAWLADAEAMREHERAAGRDVKFFAAIEVDGRGIEPFQPLTDRLSTLGADDPDSPWWVYMLADGRTEITTANRLRHLTLGQNLASEYSAHVGASHMLFMAADCRPPADAISKLIEVDWPIVGGHVSTYCLDGPVVTQAARLVEEHLGSGIQRVVDWTDMDVRAHMPTAACVLLERDFFKQIKWRADGDLGMSDDPAMYYDAEHLFRLDPPAVVRRDVVGRHYPECIGAIETRGHDMKVYR
jgi:hypothetical protein